MKISGIIKNDVVNGIDVCVSLFTQGCPHHCKGCFNSETWDFNGGYEINDLKGTLVKAISNNGINRNFSILGGEPLCPENREDVENIISAIRVAYPNIKIFVWTGYTLENLQQEKDECLTSIFNQIDYLIDGPFEENLIQYSLWLRGSSNQRVWLRDKENKTWTRIEKQED